MEIRKLKVFLLIYLFGIHPAVAQKSDIRLDKYTTWLSASGLQTFFQVGPVVMKKTSENKPVLTLTLHTATDVDALPALAFRWKLLQDSLHRRGIDIYQLLINHWATCANRSLRDVAVSLESDKPNVFSAFICYADRLVVQKKIEPGRGGGNEFGDRPVFNNIIHGSYRIADGTGSLQKYFSKLEPYFLRYRHRGGSVVIDKEVFSDAFVRLRISQVDGEVTGQSYHEIIYINLSLVKLGASEEEVSYTVDILYAAGILSAPGNEIDYRDASLDFPRELINYNNSLDKMFRKIFYAK